MSVSGFSNTKTRGGKSMATVKKAAPKKKAVKKVVKKAAPKKSGCCR